MINIPSDKSLARKASKNPDDFSDLFDRYAIKVYRYVYSRVNHHESAEDITSQVFLDAFKHITQYKPVGPFAAWLFTIARRRIADFYRKQNPTEELSDKAPQDAPEIITKVVTNEAIREVEVQLQTLNDEERELLRLRFAAGMRYKEFATLLDKKPGAVKIATYRLINRLKKNLENSNGS
jgi:RNA polymerase sigma-70 factor, ECF subfamily